MPRLDAVFWDHPELADEAKLRVFLSQNSGTPTFLWVLARFVEHGRFVDTIQFFDLSEIRRLLPQTRVSTYARNKWARFFEIYASS